MAKRSLNEALASGVFVAAPGIHDMITAVVSNSVGFDFVYASGYWMTASGFGLPDAGIASYIQIEDQEFPKKCGHTPFKRVVPIEDMVEKIKVACDARKSAETLIIARTDARQTDGFEGALRRAEVYGEAGADILFPEALESEDEMREACRRLTKPVMANMADGGKTPIRSATELQALGYALAIYPSMTGLAAAHAADQALRAFKEHGTSQTPAAPLFSFAEFNHLIGFDDVWAFEQKWARQQG